MKSFVAYPLNLKKHIFPAIFNNNASGKLVTRFELYKKVEHLKGSIIHSGISTEEEFTELSIFKSLVTNSSDVVAFERQSKELFLHEEENSTTLRYKVKRSALEVEKLQLKFAKTGLIEKIQYLSGHIEETIPDFLIDNPELKISYLCIDQNDYESSLTTLQFFYPRLMPGGLLVIENYYKNEEDYRAISDYFRYDDVSISSYSVNKGPHYLLRP